MWRFVLWYNEMTVNQDHHTGGYVELRIFLPIGCLVKAGMSYSQRCYISSFPFANHFSHTLSSVHNWTLQMHNFSLPVSLQWYKTYFYRLPWVVVMNHLEDWQEGLQSTDLCSYNTASSGNSDTFPHCTEIDTCRWEHHSPFDMFHYGSLSHRLLESSQSVYKQSGRRKSLSKLQYTVIHLYCNNMSAHKICTEWLVLCCSNCTITENWVFCDYDRSSLCTLPLYPANATSMGFPHVTWTVQHNQRNWFGHACNSNLITPLSFHS